MSQPIIYLQREFREEFIEKIQTIATDYQIKTSLNEEELQEVEISVGWSKKYSEALLQSPQLKWVQSISAGVDYLPLNEFSDRGVLLSNGSGVHALSISEHIIGVLLSYYRGLTQAVKAQKQRDWVQDTIHYHQLAGKLISRWYGTHRSAIIKIDSQPRCKGLWNQYHWSSS